MKQLHEKGLHEYSNKDHLYMLLWHLRRIGIPESSIRNYSENIIFTYNCFNKTEQTKMEGSK